MSSAAATPLAIHPVTSERWDDLVALFARPGPRGGTPMPGSCWCMWWRARTGDGAANKAAMRQRVTAGPAPGLLGYREAVPVGWVSVAPQETYGQLQTSRLYRPQEPQDGTYVIACFYIDPAHRKQDVGVQLLGGAVEHARASGARRVQAYPNERPDYMGASGWFAEAGFTPVRSAGKRTIVEREL